MRKQVITRNKNVFCLQSQLRYCKEWNSNSAITEQAVDIILKTVCKEQIGYRELKSLYLEAIHGGVNETFVSAYSIDDNYAIRKENSKVMIYYYQEETEFEKAISWRYPHIITHFGSSSIDIDYIINDWTSSTFIDYYSKYIVHFEKRPHIIISGLNDSFLIDERLRINIDAHITVTDELTLRKEYIADSWWFTPEEIINDMFSISPYEFGKKYCAKWGK